LNIKAEKLEEEEVQEVQGLKDFYSIQYLGWV
jgi:hypothetical protein